MAENLKQYENKKVIVVKKVEDGSATEIEGTVQSANDLGILIKPKGRTNFELVAKADIEEVRFVVEKPKPLDRKTLKVVEYGGARNHLLERHGYTLARINELDEQEAFNEHGKIDHVASDLGHVHGDKAETPRAEAVAAESADAQGDTATV